MTNGNATIASLDGLCCGDDAREIERSNRIKRLSYETRQRALESRCHAQARIAAYVPAEFLSYLCKIAPRSCSITAAISWSHLAQILASPSISGAIVDPLMPDHGFSIRNLLMRFSDVPVIACVSGTAEGCHAVIALSNLRVRNFIVYGVDDAENNLSSILEGMNGCESVQMAVLRNFRKSLATFPAPVNASICRLFDQPERYFSASDIAMDAGISAATLYRLCNRVNWCTPKALLIAARMLKAYQLLRHEQSVNIVARRLGYIHERVFVHHSRSVFRLLPSQLRLGLTSTEAVDSAVIWLNTKADSPGNATTSYGLTQYNHIS